MDMYGICIEFIPGSTEDAENLRDAVEQFLKQLLPPLIEGGARLYDVSRPAIYWYDAKAAHESLDF